jgi:hypothetical protein
MVTRFERVLVVLALALCRVAAGVDTIDPGEIRAGMEGVCLTEMDGDEMVEIPVSVLGVLGASAPEGELVMVRLEHPRFRETGIIAGMSGSPVYIDGKLVGALAIGWSFAKEPIGGVTPFSRMETLSPEAGSAVGGTSARPELAAIVDASQQGRLGEMLADWLLPRAKSEMEGLPLVVSAPQAAGVEWLAEGWRRMRWLSAPSGGTSALSGPEDVRPGAMVAGVLVSGNATLAVAGTVTEVRGNQVWAFGHAYLHGGSLSLPLARAHVLGVLPNQMSSFKLFNVGRTLGAWRVDRSHGMWGELGESPPMVPVEVVVNGRAYSFRSVRHPILLPYLVGYLVASSHGARGRFFGDQSLTMKAGIEYAGGLEASLSESFVGGDTEASASGLAAALVAFLEASDFPVPEVERIHVELRTEEAIRQSTIVDVIPDRLVVRPGEELAVRVRLRPYRGDDVVETLRLEVPKEAPAGRLELVVADGASWTAYDLRARPLRPGSFRDELRYVGRLVPSSRIVAALELKSPGVALRGGSAPVPLGVALTMRSGLGSSLETVTYRLAGLTSREHGAQVLGAVRIGLVVRRDGVIDRSGGEQPPAESEDE